MSCLVTKDDICNKNKFYEEVLEALIGDTVQKLDDKYYVDKDLYENIKQNLIDYLKKNKQITVAEFRDIIKSNRKTSIAILEHFDRNRITKRIEDKRILSIIGPRRVGKSTLIKHEFSEYNKYDEWVKTGKIKPIDYIQS